MAEVPITRLKLIKLLNRDNASISLLLSSYFRFVHAIFSTGKRAQRPKKSICKLYTKSS